MFFFMRGYCENNKIYAETTVLDDGDESAYRDRMNARLKAGLSKESLFTVDNLYKVPKSIWMKLYEYQKVSVRWLWELHGRSLGGLVGDEMGLGKTVQVIAFLAGLEVSELLSDGGRLIFFVLFTSQCYYLLKKYCIYSHTVIT